MKSRTRREVALLTLPVLLIGAVAWLRAGNHLPKLEISNPFDPGPIRLEYSSFTPAELTGLQASRGYDWAVQTTVDARGSWDMPSGWHCDGDLHGFPSPNPRIVYRQGQIWKQLPLKTNGADQVFYGGTNRAAIWAKLDRVPKDASEIRVRGHFERHYSYSGPIPPNWKPPVNLNIRGQNRWLKVSSKPFDVLVKGPGQPWPKATVSRGPAFEVVDGKWLTDSSLQLNDVFRDVLVVQIRRKEDTFWDPEQRLYGNGLNLYDANGHKIDLFQISSKTTTKLKSDLHFWTDAPYRFSPDRSPNDIFAIFATGFQAPKGGWASVKGPLRLTGVIGIGESWPQRLDVKIEHLQMKAEDFGAAK